MANMHLVTGYAGQEHVTAADHGSFNTALFGSGQFVLNIGNKLSASVITNNLIRVLDGDIYMQGRHIRLEDGSTADLTIENGTQGMNRNDLIVARYTKHSTTAVEEVNLVVIKGTADATSASDPSYTVGDLISGHDLQNDMPLYSVRLVGLNVTELVPLFSICEANIPELYDDKQTKTDKLTAETALADGDYFPFYDVSADAHKKTRWSNIKAVLGKLFAANNHTHTPAELGAAAASHDHAASAITSGTLPVARGGTGVASLAELTAALAKNSVARIATGSYTGTGLTGKDNAVSITLDFAPKFFMVCSDTAHNAVPLSWWGQSNWYDSTDGYFNVEDTTISYNATFYNSGLATFCNAEGVVYRWIAIG